MLAVSAPCPAAAVALQHHLKNLGGLTQLDQSLDLPSIQQNTRETIFTRPCLSHAAVPSPQPAQSAQGHVIGSGVSGSFSLAGGVYTITSSGEEGVVAPCPSVIVAF